MKKIKSIVKYFLNELNWQVTRFLCFFVKSQKNDSILLIPAANLDGGFGEDIMIMSFIENFSKGREVTIFTPQKIERKDYTLHYKNVSFIGGMLYTPINYYKTLSLLKKHSLIYVIGADIMDGTYSESMVINRLRILKLANALNIETQVSGFSVSNNILNNVKSAFIEVAKFMKIKSRDIESYKRLAQFIPENRLLLTNDIAFICPNIPSMYNQTTEYSKYIEWCKLVKLKEKKIIGVCPNSIQAKKMGFDYYMESLKKMLAFFNDTGDFGFVFLYHDLRLLCDNESDKTISEKLHNYFSSIGIDSFFTSTINNGVELKGYLSEIDFTVTGRMHFGISGLTFKKPMFGIAYANKFEGMVRLFDLDPNLCLVDYDKMNLDLTKNKVDSFCNLQQKIIEKVNIRLELVQQDTQNNFLKL